MVLLTLLPVQTSFPYWLEGGAADQDSSRNRGLQFQQFPCSDWNEEVRCNQHRDLSIAEDKQVGPYRAFWAWE